MLAAIRRNVAWSVIPIAGLVAGSVHLLTNILISDMLLDMKPSVFLRYAGALLLGPDSLTDEATVLPIVVGLIMHFALSIFFTMVIAIVVHRWGLVVGIVGGALLGLAIYAINMYTVTVLFPWFFALNGPAILVSHVLFGAVAGGVYETFDYFDLPTGAYQ